MDEKAIKLYEDDPAALCYKGCKGKVKINIEDEVIYGYLTNISDLVSFECHSVHEVISAFKKCVDGYLEDKSGNGIQSYDQNVRGIIYE